MQEVGVGTLRALFICFILFIPCCGLAFGQNAAPLSSGIFPSPNDLNRHHMGPTGKPCLALQGDAQAQAINKNIFEHRVTAKNNCGRNIKVKVCYHNSQDCIIMDVPPWGRRDSVLGIYPALKDFRYDAKEQF
jgi:hypothetical protein